MKDRLNKRRIRSSLPMLIVLLALIMVTNSVFARIGDRKVVANLISEFSDFPAQADQQKKSISGKVTDASGATLPGVSVAVKGTTNGVITDSNGKFTLSNLPDNAILQFTFVGMKAQEVILGDGNVVNIQLEQDDQSRLKLRLVN